MNVHTVLLAAGRGDRLRPLTDARPKALLDVGGTPLVARVVAQLAARGLTRITIVDGYRGDMLRAALLDRFPSSWFRFVRNEAWATTNNAYSLHLAHDSDHAPLFLLDSDIAFSDEALDRLLGDAHPNRLAVRTHGSLGEEEMKVRLAPDGTVADVGKDVDPLAAIGESVGLEIFDADTTRRLFEILDRRVLLGPGRHEFYEASFVELIRGGAVVHPVDLGSAVCMEIDTPDDLEAARAAFGSGA